MKNNLGKQGFALPLILTVIVVVGIVIGFFGLQFYLKNKVFWRPSIPDVSKDQTPTPQATSPAQKALTDFPIPKANWSTPEKATFEAYNQCERKYQEFNGYKQSISHEGESNISWPSDEQLSETGWYVQFEDAAGGIEADRFGYAKRGDCRIDKAGKHLIVLEKDLNAKERIEKQTYIRPKMEITIFYN